MIQLTKAMKRNKYLLILGILFSLWVGWEFLIDVDGSNQVALPNYEEELLLMKQTNDSLQQLSQALDSMNLHFVIQADCLVYLLATEKQIIHELKQQRNEKIEVIDHYDGDELLQFFANLETHRRNTGE